MKVLHVIDSLGVGGGAEHSLANLLPLLDERGVVSTIATIRHRDGGLQGRLGDAGYPIEVLPANHWPGRVRALRSKVLRERPDLVHSTLYNSCLTSRCALLRTGVPSVNSLVSTSYDRARTGGIDTAAWKLTAVRWADISSVRAVTRVHAVNEAVAEEARTVLRVPNERITIVPRGRDVATLGSWSLDRRRTTRVRLGLSDDVPVVLNVGRQDHPKAQADLIRAFATVATSVPDAVLLIAGREGDATPEVDRAIADVALGDRIKMLGHRDDVADLYVAADLFAFPSLYEGAAGSIIEAMALDCPVIGSDAVAVSEVLHSGELGSVVRRGDVAGLTAAITRMLTDEAMRRRFARLGHAEFEQRYRIDAVADATVDMYRFTLRRVDTAPTVVNPATSPGVDHVTSLDEASGAGPSQVPPESVPDILPPGGDRHSHDPLRTDPPSP